jgi:hypothetical protein
MVSEHRVDHGECFLLICGLFFLGQFSHQIGLRRVGYWIILLVICEVLVGLWIVQSISDILQ